MSMKIAVITLLFTLLLVASVNATEEGIVIASINDEKFLIETIWGKQLFEAKTYCFNINEGDRVIFMESTAVCVSNVFIDLNTRVKCEVWCE